MFEVRSTSLRVTGLETSKVGMTADDKREEMESVRECVRAYSEECGIT